MESVVSSTSKPSSCGSRNMFVMTQYSIDECPETSTPAMRLLTTGMVTQDVGSFMHRSPYDCRGANTLLRARDDLAHKLRSPVLLKRFNIDAVAQMLQKTRHNFDSVRALGLGNLLEVAGAEFGSLGGEAHAMPTSDTHGLLKLAL